MVSTIETTDLPTKAKKKAPIKGVWTAVI